MQPHERESILVDGLGKSFQKFARTLRTGPQAQSVPSETIWISQKHFPHDNFNKW